MPRDGADTQNHSGQDEAEAACLCAACRGLITRPQWAIVVNGVHERALFNPAGRVFRVVCYREAPGVLDLGAPSIDFTWFPGYAWVIVLCRRCGAHLGWRYQGPGAPEVFFGLIKPMLDIAQGPASE